MRGPHYDPAHPWVLPPATQDVTLTTADGVHLDGWFTTAAEPRNGVTVLALHGNNESLDSLAPEVTFLRQRGFDVFAIDYRGFGRSESFSWNEAALRLDGMAALQYLTQTRGIAPQTISFFGQSLGTALAADLAVTSPCHALVLMAPIASSREQTKAVFPRLPEFLYALNQSPLDTVGKIARAQCPVMVVHGDADKIVDVAQGRAVYEAARSPKRLIIVPHGGHVPSLSQGGSYVDEVVAFLATPPR